MDVVTPGEISVGMYLTVYEVNHLNDKNKWNENNMLPLLMLQHNGEMPDNLHMYEKMKGIPMKVISIQLPYLAVQIIPDDKAPIIAIDTRKCILMELNGEFAKKFTQ